MESAFRFLPPGPNWSRGAERWQGCFEKAFLRFLGRYSSAPAMAKDVTDAAPLANCDGQLQACQSGRARQCDGPVGKDMRIEGGGPMASCEIHCNCRCLVTKKVCWHQKRKEKKVIGRQYQSDCKVVGICTQLKEPQHPPAYHRIGVDVILPESLSGFGFSRKKTRDTVPKHESGRFDRISPL